MCTIILLTSVFHQMWVFQFDQKTSINNPRGKDEKMSEIDLASSVSQTYTINDIPKLTKITTMSYLPSCTCIFVYY